MLDFSFGTRVPVILQTEAAECGLASLAMVADYHGYKTNISHLRQRYSFSAKGANLAQLMQAASDLGFAHRAVRLEPEVLQHLKLPCILHWNLNHFVVLARISRSRFVIHDPAQGERWMSQDEVSKHFTGVALELTPTDHF